tara:strand:+ start:908 stop:2074 length:1167 start_codon:yes stop_codon:yes gene_type:complete
MSEIKVNSIKGVGASTAAITVNNTDGTCTANITNNLSNRRLTINGAMTIAQRSTSSTADGYNTIDRYYTSASANDESPTYSQVDVASGTTPYSLGFRKALRITNGNQTSGAQAGSSATIYTPQEAQNIANSGWNYTSSSGNITLSFWVKASVSKTYYFYFKTPDGSAYLYPMETGVLSADTWTKVTKTIPGNSNITINNDNGVGIEIMFWAYAGTNFTDAGVSLNTWQTYSGSARLPVDGTSWWTTNDATFEITGLQLEVGDHATDFEHRSFTDEYLRCARYFQKFEGLGDSHMLAAAGDGTTTCKVGVPLAVPLRAQPTVACGSHRWFRSSSVALTTSTTAPSVINYSTDVHSPVIALFAGGHTTSNNEAGVWTPHNGNHLTLDCEL